MNIVLSVEQLLKLKEAAQTYKASREAKRAALKAANVDLSVDDFRQAVEVANKASCQSDLKAHELASLIVNYLEV